ncbi:phosphotransferase family protein [Nocardia asiatica]|uniref:phosphotransferase family protein n=1 Tax=Nocardia asiatica TaxID=209252 RepID=UPI001C3F3665|nr:aminoglycoside phosphotransferase family protein [Nocardia asiatica]
MEEVEVIVAHQERVTLRAGDVFLKIDADQTRTDAEVEAMARAPIPTPEILWRRPPVLALAALPGRALGRLGEPSAASPAAWAAAGAAIRMLHNAPLPPWPGHSGRGLAELTAQLDVECAWLVTNDVLPADLVVRNRQAAEAALRPWAPVFTHGDLQVGHVFVTGDEITGVIDWSEAGQGDALYDLATLTLGHEERLGDVVAGYGTDVDIDVIRAWWSLRSLLGVRWLIEHGFDPTSPGCEVDVLRTQAMRLRGIRSHALHVGAGALGCLFAIAMSAPNLSVTVRVTSSVLPPLESNCGRVDITLPNMPSGSRTSTVTLPSTVLTTTVPYTTSGCGRTPSASPAASRSLDRLCAAPRCAIPRRRRPPHRSAAVSRS